MSTARLLQSADVPGALTSVAADRNGFEDEYPFVSHWADIDGHIMHYVDEGSGPVLLMVHGNPTWSFAWRHLVRELSTSYRVIAVDHIGCGFSAKPQDDVYTLGGHISRLVALVEALDLTDITLFAHDWGGAIGMGTAGRLPDRFAKFVLMNTGAFRSTEIPFRIALCRIPLLGTIGMQAFNLFSQAAVFMATEKGLSPAARRGLLAPYNSWSNRRAVREFVHDIPLKPSHRSYQTLVDVENGLAQFANSPVLLVWGMKDWCFTPSFYNEFRRHFPQAQTVEISDGGHYIFEDSPEELLNCARDFLSQRSAPPVLPADAAESVRANLPSSDSPTG
ncbi:MAG: alpha/beta fold hydrolase [Planctomycetaceae bacterium]|nr:alpha/beta fold hydrolase [Planctomycetaceae bacterium]